MKTGNAKQRCACKAIMELGILDHLADYNPVLCGTIPISIDIAGSDLDIIMEVHDFEDFKSYISSLYGMQDEFIAKEKTIRNIPTIKANFKFQGFEFELFGQPLPIERQNAFLHMIVEHYLLKMNPDKQTEIICLKEEGLKTEPAFAKVFGLKGNPYEALLDFGKALGILK